MPTMTVGPCAWTPTHTHHSVADLAEWNALPAAIRTLADSVGAAALWAATGRRFDACPKIARPLVACVHNGEATWLQTPYPGAYMGAGELLTFPSGGQCCLDHDPKRFHLDGPVVAISSITIDGVVFAAANYRLDDGWIVTRIDGLNWPLWQDVSLPGTAVGAFVVNYTAGISPPAWLLAIAGTYALEVGRGMNGSAACRLPSRVAAITRQGVDIEFVSPEVLLENGLTGIAEIDTTIQALNPGRLVAPLRVFVPNLTPPIVGS